MRKRIDPIEESLFRRAHAVVRSSRATAQCQQDMTASRGRKRNYTYEALFTVAMITALEGYGELLLSDIAQTVRRLTPTQREVLGIAHDWSYDLVEQAVAELGAAMKETVEPETGEVIEPRLKMTEYSVF